MKKFRMFPLILCVALLLSALVLPASAASKAWDGTTIDVSWYNKTDKTFYISTPEQFMGLAAIVNGLYNTNINNVIGDKSVIVDNHAEGDESGTLGNNKSTSVFHYGADDFNGKTVYLTADLDMGGVYDAKTDTWSGPNYMPIGGQYLMTKNDSATKLSASFNGVLDGQGHTIYNVYCDRHCSNGNYGDGQSVGLIGRMGAHDADPLDIRPTEPAVRNLAVTGYIHANRSVGGIVGKTGKTTYNSGDDSLGSIIENCANFATVTNTDAKGCGGIVGAGWNGGIVRNCYNAGTISSTYACPTAGISGSNEIILENCYNVGKISASRDSYAMSIGTNNGGAPSKNSLKNCWYLEGSAPGGGYYDSRGPVDTGAMTAADMKKEAFVTQLGSAFAADRHGINNGYPILKWQENILYADVGITAWYYDNVMYVSERGYFDAIAPGKFEPSSPMTRAMLATALYRMAGSPKVTDKAPFTDIPSGASYADAVAWCYFAGVVNGTSETTFTPEASITREQIVTMFHRYAEKVAKADMSVSNDLTKFTDKGSVSAWASDGMKWAVAAGLINGMTDTTIVPQGTAIRAQVAAMVQRLDIFVA